MSAIGYWLLAIGREIGMRRPAAGGELHMKLHTNTSLIAVD